MDRLELKYYRYNFIIHIIIEYGFLNMDTYTISINTLEFCYI